MFNLLSHITKTMSLWYRGCLYVHSYVHPSYSREWDASVLFWWNFFKFGTNFHFGLKNEMRVKGKARSVTWARCDDFENVHTNVHSSESRVIVFLLRKSLLWVFDFLMSSSLPSILCISPFTDTKAFLGQMQHFHTPCLFLAKCAFHSVAIASHEALSEISDALKAI